MTTVHSVDPRTHTSVEEVAPETSVAEVAALVTAAADAAPALESLGRAGRARMLRAMADALEDDREPLVRLTDRETALGPARLGGELTRTTFQLRFFAEVIEDGEYLGVTIDHAGSTPMGTRPDLRRMLRPLGPVGVFGASNFPFAFSVAGGDTASALAAGCPVLVKAHSSHPASSVRQAAALRRGAASTGAPEATVGLVFGQSAGRALVEHPRVTAVGFTGSVSAGRRLHDLAKLRARPIPFYGELGALNTLTITPAAAHERAQSIGEGLAASFTLGVGQFCTKPGLALVPTSADGDALVTALVERARATASAVMLNRRTVEGFTQGTAVLRGAAGARTLVGSGAGPKAGGGAGPFEAAVSPVVVEVAAADVRDPMLEECFGPALVIARYGAEAEAVRVLEAAGPGLTASLHAGERDEIAGRLLGRLTDLAGRVVWNGFPTGVAVAWAMHHGGGYPASTDALHTSVGAAAIRRWLRPVSYQDVPEALLPAELRDDGVGVVRRIDGRLVGLTP